MGNSILSWRRVRALCVKETRQIVRDPSSWLDRGGDPPAAAVYLRLRH